MPLLITSAAIAGASALGKGIYGLHQQHKSNKELKQLEANRPQRVTDPNILYNQSIARNIASEGIPSSAKNYYTESINRGLGSGINAILQGGGDINMIASLVGGATDSYKQLLAADSQQKLYNQGMAMQQNQNVANENQANFNWNVANPYLQDFSKYTQQSNSGAQNTYGALTDLGGAGASLYGAGVGSNSGSMFSKSNYSNPYAKYAGNSESMAHNISGFNNTPISTPTTNYDYINY